MKAKKIVRGPRKYNCYGRIGSFGYIWRTVFDTLYDELSFWMQNQSWYIFRTVQEYEWFKTRLARRTAWPPQSSF